jgi:DNA-binding transcriptional regulator GbsR (MarR family)
MTNMSRKRQSGSKLRFIEDVARLMIPWGVPPAAARLYGYLLLCSEPVSLDRMAADLEISKSSASVAARLLEQYRLALRHSERGSKRVLYEVSQDYDGILIEQNRLLDGLAKLLKSGESAVASGKAQNRLEEMAEFYRTIRQSMDTALRRWRASRLR